MQLKPKSLGFAVFMGMIVTGVSGCGQPTNVPPPVTTIDSETAAVVNGEPIYVLDVELEAVAQGQIEPNSDFGPRNPEFSPSFRSADRPTPIGARSGPTELRPRTRGRPPPRVRTRAIAGEYFG